MATDFNKYFKHYLDQVEGLKPLAALIVTHTELLTLLNNISEEKGNYKYDEGKWTVKEVIAHIIDVERVFAYRALRFARNDTTELAGFDDKLYGENSNAETRILRDMSSEFDLLRQSSLAMFHSFENSMWQRSGSANKIDFTVKKLALLIAGHGRHHGKILQERYGV